MMMVAKVFKKVSLNSQPTDFAYWQTQSYQERLQRWSRSGESTTAGNTMLNQDFKEFIQSLNDNAVRYLVVGGYAVALHGHPRYTKDIDICSGQRHGGMADARF